MKPEVVVGSVRRRRRSPKPDTPGPPHIRNLVVYIVLSVLVAALMFNGFLTDRPAALPLPLLSQTTDVRSTIWEAGDSLQIEIGWDLTISAPEGIPDSIRVRVVQDSTEILTLTQPGSELADTAYIQAPKPGETVNGLSCVAAHHGAGVPIEEVCTPWQYVRPFSTAGVSASRMAGRNARRTAPLQIDRGRVWPLCRAASKPFAAFGADRGEPPERPAVLRAGRQADRGTPVCEERPLLR